MSKITLEDVRYAEAFHCVIKLIGSVKRLADGKIDIIVAPMLVPNKSQLANIDYEFNGIMVRGDCTGDVVFYGKGAGKLPTAGKHRDLRYQRQDFSRQSQAPEQA